MSELSKIAVGGGCHWCTEAVFQSLKGVQLVEQGFVASTGKNSNFSEAVIVHFNPSKITLETIIETHLYTHKSTSAHSMRSKYRSAIYTYSEDQQFQATKLLEIFQKKFDKKLITQIFNFEAFKPSREEITNYYRKNPEKPFCTAYLKPKLDLLKKQFPENLKQNNEF